MLSVTGLSKTFGQLKANDAIDLDIAEGEIHALIGENGAGKSTLVKMLYGTLAPDSGEILWHGKPVKITNPNAARALGIGMIFQHFALFEALNVAENITLALPKGPSSREIENRLEVLSRSYGLPLDPQAQIADLSTGERQRVEIMRCLLADPKLIIMDEPTSVLTPQEIEALLETLKKIRAEGRSILYISHKLEEVIQLCDRATILRHGKVVAKCNPAETSKNNLAQLMVGNAIANIEQRKVNNTDNTPVFIVNNLSLNAPSAFGTALREISFSLKPGNISAIAGIAGNGQNELFNALSGEQLAPNNEQIEIFGKPSGHDGISARRKAGAAFISEDRMGHGAAPTLSLSNNVILTRATTDKTLLKNGFINMGKAHAIREEICENFDVRRGQTNPAAGALSGGNLQKFIIGREIGRNPKLLIINQPTWGVDAGAAQHVRQTLIDCTTRGMAILFISQDLDEIFELADEIAVLFEGTLSDFRPISEVTRESIGLLMAGETLPLTGREVPNVAHS